MNWEFVDVIAPSEKIDYDNYLNNRGLLLKALSCDRFPEEISRSQQILAYMKFEHQISEGTYHT